MQGYKREFPDLTIHKDLEALISTHDLEDWSWHNDSTASFYSPAHSLKLWVWDVDPKKRVGDCEGAKQFCLESVNLDSDGCEIGNPDIVVITEDFEEIKKHF